MKEILGVLGDIAGALIPSIVTLNIFSIFIIMFFVTLKNNPIEEIINPLAVLGLEKYHRIIAPFTPVETEAFGTKVYCKDAAGVLQCFSLYPKENIQNIGLWYGISLVSSATIRRIYPGGKDK